MLSEQGFPFAQYNLGLSYLKGEGVEVDYSKAVELITLASNSKLVLIPAAKYDLGVIYLTGLGVDKNQDKANKLFYQSCSLGYQPACKRCQANMKELEKLTGIPAEFWESMDKSNNKEKE
ncbi:tetratricopeptide repeat protein [Pasteurella atlantica]|uniref:tetratricopeptide repeat protein n=1 Tax=Pasteurella atlantica TaxID=2827233 RepID=UPI00276B0FD8|nr:tetratricopeptide repeat protein [Pasteurella atlantica]MDP8100137.1 tetratricopeptide repeat protein [Pasteurella atlantica]MDP8108053.1 tetratricopeptide repeat protein [Pasteurella atlantica]MDP8117745.1 tetratricopeptide repeat protein [Pasteurella atlantica]